MKGKARKVGPFSHKSMADNAAIYWQNQRYNVGKARKTKEGWFVPIKK